MNDIYQPSLAHRDVTWALEAVQVEEEDYNIRDAYSGRGMNGATCAAVDIPGGKFTAFLMALAVRLTQAGREEDAMLLGEQVVTDQMGRDGLIVYWPNVTFTS